jgi:hypothetical protein
MLAFMAAFARLLWVTRQLRGRSVLWVGALLALTDAGYTVYWNSFYAEPASGIFFLLLLAEGIELAQGTKLTPAAAARWAAWSFLWAMAKPQNAGTALLMALLTFGLCRWRAAPKAVLAAIAGGCALVGAAAYSVAAMPEAGFGPCYVQEASRRKIALLTKQTRMGRNLKFLTHRACVKTFRFRHIWAGSNQRAIFLLPASCTQQVLRRGSRIAEQLGGVRIAEHLQPWERPLC